MSALSFLSCSLESVIKPTIKHFSLLHHPSLIWPLKRLYLRCGRHVCDNSVHGQSWRNPGSKRESGPSESKSKQFLSIFWEPDIIHLCPILSYIIHRQWNMLAWPSRWHPSRMLRHFSSAHPRLDFKAFSWNIFYLHFMQSMPILRAFCFFAGTGVIFLYIFACSYFVACLVLDERRRYFFNVNGSQERDKINLQGVSTCIKARMDPFSLDSFCPVP